MLADEGWRSPPATPYSPNGATLRVPQEAVLATYRLLQAAGRMESCLFWYGLREGADGIVTAVRAPEQRSTPFNYHVDEAALSRMAATIPDELRPLAQIHSHPGHLVEHSPYDDVMVASRRALSLVFPHYGRELSMCPKGIGVHEWQGGYWHMLPESLAASRVLVVDGPVDVEDLR